MKMLVEGKVDLLTYQKSVGASTMKLEKRIRVDDDDDEGFVTDVDEDEYPDLTPPVLEKTRHSLESTENQSVQQLPSNITSNIEATDATENGKDKE